MQLIKINILFNDSKNYGIYKARNKRLLFIFKKERF